MRNYLWSLASRCQSWMPATRCHSTSRWYHSRTFNHRSLKQYLLSSSTRRLYHSRHSWRTNSSQTTSSSMKFSMRNFDQRRRCHVDFRHRRCHQSLSLTRADHFAFFWSRFAFASSFLLAISSSSIAFSTHHSASQESRSESSDD